MDYNLVIAEVAELADAHDSKSCDLTVMRVQLPPSALVVSDANSVSLEKIKFSSLSDGIPDQKFLKL